MNLKKILESHRLWQNGQGGERANLRGARLWGADFSRANLSLIDLRGADLSDANLGVANLRRASLNRADLSEANLSGADLSGADLRGADLWGADLREANLLGANLRGADLREADLREALRGDCTLKGFKASIQRSDGYEFFLWDTKQGWRVDAGCRWFTFEEADRHWKSTRKGTPLGDETFDILRFFKARAKG